MCDSPDERTALLRRALAALAAADLIEDRDIARVHMRAAYAVAMQLVCEQAYGVGDDGCHGDDDIDPRRLPR